MYAQIVTIIQELAEICNNEKMGIYGKNSRAILCASQKEATIDRRGFPSFAIFAQWCKKTPGHKLLILNGVSV